MTEGDKHAEGVKRSIEDIIGAGTSLKIKRKSENDVQKGKFIDVIKSLEELEVRSMILGNDLQLDFSSYNENFYIAIDNLIYMLFGKEASEVIFFYLYERINPDGSVNKLVDAKDEQVELTSPDDLWEVVKHLSSQNKTKNARR